MYLVKPLSRDKGSGRYTMYLPFSPQGICRAKGADTLCICQTPCPERGTLPDTWAIPKHTSGQTHFWGCPIYIGLTPLQKCVGDSCCIMLEDFAGESVLPKNRPYFIGTNCAPHLLWICLFFSHKARVESTKKGGDYESVRGRHVNQPLFGMMRLGHCYTVS